MNQPNNTTTPQKPRKKPAFSKWLRWVLLLLVLVVGAGAFISLRRSSADSHGSNQNPGTFTVKRGDLTISVTESGDVKPLNSIDIMSEVEGETTLISIVDEGSYITPEDVNNGKVLAELDSSRIKEELTQQKITFLTARADYTDANEALEIQKKQNESDIQTGQMNARFALIDLHKYLGEIVAQKLISYTANPGHAHAAIVSLIHHSTNDPNLGGDALQQLRVLDDKIKLADMELNRATDKLEGTRKLYEKDYVAEIELKADKLGKESFEIQKKQAETAKDLFINLKAKKQLSLWRASVWTNGENSSRPVL
ncbi:MAG: hypothetical protein ACYSWR_01240 [Planctomycetota bacterium]|jgi:HlyD family secretion protein